MRPTSEPDPIDPAADRHSIRRAIDHSLIGFQVIGFDWTYVYVNPAAARHGASTPKALIGRTLWEAYPGIEETPLAAILRRCMAERVPYTFDNLFTGPDGEQRWFDIRIEPGPEGLSVYSIDIHDRKMSEIAHQHTLPRAPRSSGLRRWLARLVR